MFKLVSIQTKIRRGLISLVEVSREDLRSRYVVAERMFPSESSGDSELFAAML